jgi:hypothetical protein
MSRAITSRSVASREARPTAGVIAGPEGLHQLGKLRALGDRAGDLLAEYLCAPGRLQLFDLATLVLGGG